VTTQGSEIVERWVVLAVMYTFYLGISFQPNV